MLRPARLLKMLIADDAFVLANHFEDRKRPPQNRIRWLIGLDHHELPGLRLLADGRRGQRQHVVVVGEPHVADHRRIDVDGHCREYSDRCDRCDSDARGATGASASARVHSACERGAETGRGATMTCRRSARTHRATRAAALAHRCTFAPHSAPSALCRTCCTLALELTVRFLRMLSNAVDCRGAGFCSTSRSSSCISIPSFPLALRRWSSAGAGDGRCLRLNLAAVLLRPDRHCVNSSAPKCCRPAG